MPIATAVFNWPLAGGIVAGTVVVTAIVFLLTWLPNHERRPILRGLLSVLGMALGLLVIADIVLVVEFIAHLIDPNFVDTGA